MDKAARGRRAAAILSELDLDAETHEVVFRDDDPGTWHVRELGPTEQTLRRRESVAVAAEFARKALREVYGYDSETVAAMDEYEAIEALVGEDPTELPDPVALVDRD